MCAIFHLTPLHAAADRTNDYQHYALDAVLSCSQFPDMGAQVRGEMGFETRKNIDLATYVCYL